MEFPPCLQELFRIESQIENISWSFIQSPQEVSRTLPELDIDYSPRKQYLAMSLTNHVALITGGTKNLGASIARELAAMGADIALHYISIRTRPVAEAFQEQLSTAYPNARIKLYAGDLTTESNVNALFFQVVKDFGKLDIMVNTIGMVLKKPMTSITEAEYDSMFDVNSKAAFFCVKAGAAHVSEGGKLITIVTSLLAAYTGSYTSYAGSKAPVEHFTRGLAKELMARKISVNAVAPGPMDTR